MANVLRLNLTPEQKLELKTMFNIDPAWLSGEYRRRFGRILKVISLKETCVNGSCGHKDHNSEVDVAIHQVSDTSPGFKVEWIAKG